MKKIKIKISSNQYVRLRALYQVDKSGITWSEFLSNEINFLIDVELVAMYNTEGSTPNQKVYEQYIKERNVPLNYHIFKITEKPS